MGKTKMAKTSNRPNHRPPHLIIDDTWYFITAHIINKNKILEHPGHKEFWINTLHELANSGNVRVFAWVILTNHYHILAKFEKAQELPSFINKLHGRTSYQFNKIENISGRNIWYSYWDSIIRGEKDFWTRFNYIHYNPVKHQLAQKPEDWQYSSYQHYLKTKGLIWLSDCWESYPILEYDYE
jgi:putative transposase